MSCEKRKDGYAPCLAKQGVPDTQASAVYFEAFERPDFKDPPQKSIWKRLLQGMGQGLMYALVFRGGLGESMAYAIGYGTTEFINKGRKPVPAWQAEPGDYIETNDGGKWQLLHTAEDGDGRYLRLRSAKTGDVKFLHMRGKKAVAQLSKEDFLARWGRDKVKEPVKPPANRPLIVLSGFAQARAGETFILPDGLGKHSGRSATVVERNGAVLRVLSEHPDKKNIGYAVLHLNTRGQRVNPDGSPYAPPQDRRGKTDYAAVKPDDLVTIPNRKMFGGVRGETGTVISLNDKGFATVRVTKGDKAVSMLHINAHGERVNYDDGQIYQTPSLPETQPLQPPPPGPRGDGTIFVTPSPIQGAGVGDMVQVSGEWGFVDKIADDGKYHIYCPATDRHHEVEPPPQVVLPDELTYSQG